MTSEASETSANSMRRGIGSGALRGLFIALALVVSTLLAASTARDVAPVRDSIQVKGYAEKRVQSDMGVWSGQFSTRAGSLKQAYADLQQAQKRVEGFLAAQGIKDGIEYAPVQTMPLYRFDPNRGMTNEIQGYELVQAVKVTSRDVARLTDLSREVSSLISEGVQFMSMPPQFYYGGLESLKLELLASATANARERATALAEAGGSRVGALQSARQGVFQVTPAISTEVSDYGVYDTSSIEKTVKAVVTVTFALR